MATTVIIGGNGKLAIDRVTNLSTRMSPEKVAHTQQVIDIFTRLLNEIADAVEKQDHA